MKLSNKEYLKLCDDLSFRMMSSMYDMLGEMDIEVQDKSDIATQAAGMCAAKIISVIVSHMPGAPIDEASMILEAKVLGAFQTFLQDYKKRIPIVRASVEKDHNESLN